MWIQGKWKPGLSFICGLVNNPDIWKPILNHVTHKWWSFTNAELGNVKKFKQDVRKKVSIYRLCIGKWHLRKTLSRANYLNRTWFWCLWLNSQLARKDSIQFSKWWLYFMPGNKHRRCTVKKCIFVLWKNSPCSSYIFILMLKLSLCLLVLNWTKETELWMQ